MKITPRMAIEIAHHEAIIRQAYKDSVGVWTWSAGITSASGHKVERYINNPQIMQKCLEVYIWLLEEKYAPAVRRAFTGIDLTEAQFTAALSFHWNTGGIARASWVKSFRKGDIAAARKSFMAWRKPKEIIPRRQSEYKLFFDGVWSGDGKVTEYTRLTKKHSPVWGSAVRVDIRDEIAALLKPATPANPNPFAALITALLTIFTRR